MLSRFLTLCVVIFLGPQFLPAQTIQTDSNQKIPRDSRLQLKDLNGFFPFFVPDTLADWEKRAEELRLRIKVACGLHPMPVRSPLHPVIHGKITRPGFTVEKVYFESHPGLYVTGLLFKPEVLITGKKYPTVLCPHGHGGRLQDHGETGVFKEIVKGAERFADSGRMPKIAMCGTLARQGYIVFVHDMFGYADSQQLSYELTHKYARRRDELEQLNNWGLFSTQAELHLISVFGLQTWNAIRALDFLESLPEVDPKKIAVTGNSGGGTQTIILCAIDPRPVANFPNGMVSSSMQGGCTCENTSLLRIGTGNVEFAALFAPKPQGMTAANDWTKEMLVPGKGFSELQKLYELYGKKNNVMCKDLTYFDHSFNYPTRAVMYSWFNKHLNMGLNDPIVEDDFPLISPAEQTVWDEKHPAPPGGVEYELKLMKWLASNDQELIQKSSPTDKQHLLRQGWKTLIGRNLPEAGEISYKNEKLKYIPKPLGTTANPEVVDSYHEEIPVINLQPKITPKFTVIWTHPEGKRALIAPAGQTSELVHSLQNMGGLIISADLFGQGDFLPDGKELTKTSVVNNPREFAGYTHGYNHSLFAQRTHDILSLIAYAQTLGQQPIYLIGEGNCGIHVAAAMSIAGTQIHKAIIDNTDFRFANITNYRDPMFLPGAVKYGDVPGLLDLTNKTKLHTSKVDSSSLIWLLNP